ncbi:V-type ATP synthase subunit I [Anaeromicropila herbilytica]|uniref:V-type ATP synthase subunit I n=1 Tax=Anaeromicropila herbilytica TaxID=2785025 RepID=A0A7R7ER65_9FIRM|nr:V-type ATPase 116kDa subunit family protein [Anaeromicropila herbilytica]BCN33002.1 V-type ATP synthase subunit I [Anaeromicropila herbilytica]
MIEKMKFISITGPRKEIDRVADTYLSKYEIHLENTLSELTTVEDLKPYIEGNPFRDILTKSEELIKVIDMKPASSNYKMTSKQAADIVNSAHSTLEDYNDILKGLRDKRTHYNDLMKQIEPFRVLDYDIDKIMKFKFVQYQFGRISREHYEDFKNYVNEHQNTILVECDADLDYVWAVYFVPCTIAADVNEEYLALRFENIDLPDEYQGKPEEAYQSLQNQLTEVSAKIESVKQELHDKLSVIADDIIKANETLKRITKNHEVRKLAACTKSLSDEDSSPFSFFVLCGWMSDKDAKNFAKDIEDDKTVYCFIEDIDFNETKKPPTKLKNPSLVRPFEAFIHMYGLPAYNEIDPTIFLAITYTIMFGAMFGDAGQGLCLLIGGFILYKLKKIDLAAIISMAGLSSTIFGFLYGSIFGYEDLIPTLWTKPIEDSMTVLGVAIGFGIFLILVAMIMNIINSIRAKDIEKIFFDQNGIAGLIFYVAVLLSAFTAFTTGSAPAIILLILFIGLPLIIIFLKEPITHLVERKKEILPENKGMFFVEAFFELFEIILSYITNTVSFVRVGAFALSHAGMMEVVLMLGKATESHPNFVIIILGNIFVAGFEGLIVGIQVLRLEYYEMFSRFYRGTGRKFDSF